MATICSSALQVHSTKKHTCILANSPDHQSEAPLLNRPNSIWVNPTKITPSVLTLQRHKRSSISYTPHIKKLKSLIKNLNDSSLSDLLHVLENYPSSLSGDDAFLLLNNFKSWQKTLLFFDWIKTRNLFAVETIYYNVTMKSLRFGRQFQHIENLAFEMIHNRVELDNITYSTIITCAKRCNLYDKAIEWFERMYKTGLMPDEVTYSAVLDVYGKLRRAEEVVSLYERGRASGWKPDTVAFAVLGKLFAQAGDYDGLRYVFQEMKAVEVEPDLFLYNTLFEALIKAKKPGLAKGLFGSMISSGIKPNEKTLTALVRIFGKARWAKDALGFWEKLRSNKWAVNNLLYNTLLNMCADLGLEEEAEGLFEDMKKSEKCKPDSWSYTAMLNIYGSAGYADKAMDLFDEMSELEVELNIMGCTCLIQCLGKARRIDDLVEVFRVSIDRDIKPDDRLSGCLLSVVSFCEGEDLNKVLSCLQEANSKLVDFIRLLENGTIDFNTLSTEFREMLNETSVDSQRPFCNCLIDFCRNRNLLERSHDLLHIGLACNLYPGLHTKTPEEWRLNVRSLSVGAAHTALEDWMSTVIKLDQHHDTLPELFSASTGAGTHKYSQGLANEFASHVNKLDAPFRRSSEEPGFFVASREDLVSWVQSRVQTASGTA
ncbi:hypothetical protein DCAR_0831010 [Daucus carota subsp. sativus]|uniref:PROP1-like PPR domain-containing protein n=1 Tax=Daucus carota subsp. sativus TaxID=79200 RepID=A0AAF0XNW2_DAUCS|nr:PREDICTED: pentatricopeptide repeat-containing protein At5g46580, chloroplastic-like [Daucus carota subsp. sativus]WOH11523.1 hypothetical protein DCAR_0831010 [Daucus carota subsp. sativus]